MIKGLIRKFFEPPFFFSALGVIFVAWVYVIHSLRAADKRQSEESDDEVKRDKLRVGELEKMVVDREEEHKRKISNLENNAKSKEQELQRRIMELEAKLKEKERLMENIQALEMQLMEKEEALKKLVSSEGEWKKTLKNLQEESAKLKSDLSLKGQMYDGLKGQYDELEKEVFRLTKQADEEMKSPKEKNPERAPVHPDSESEGSPS